MKQRLVKLYRFDRGSISEGQISAEDIESQIVTLADSFLIFAFEKYKKEKFDNGKLITEIIKVMLPAIEDDAKKEWKQGLTFNGHTYYAWFATTGGMKKEGMGKCETFFIREDYRQFANEFEDLLSLGKFNEIEESGEEICINKDILSRISLATSSSFMAGDMPDFIVLPQPQYRIIKDYKTVEKFTVQKEEETIVDYKLVDHHFDDDIDVFDGGAIATPSVFEQIRQSLELDYPVEFAIIRGYGVGIKGMITKFDITGYLDEIYKEDTEYCRKLNDQYELKDMWNEWQPVTENTMLLNESMVKLAKYYDAAKGENMKTYKERLEKVDAKYKGIINKLYVTKVNKPDRDIADYRRTNYQLINALALSKADYFELIKNDVKSYRKILKPFNKASASDEWVINIDAIRLFFKNILQSDLEDSEALEEEIKYMSQNVVMKCEELLHISENFVKLKYVRNNLARLIEKKCRELASGKFTVKAKYQYIAPCPISYLNFAMYRKQGEDGLQEGQFYSADCQNGDVRTISRNPLCAYSEIHNVTFVRDEKFETWFSPCRELIYFNQKSNILALMSSADADGDACTAIDNEIIRNAVVIPKDGKYFINKDDGHKELMKYNSENRFLATYRASGNLIGSISLKAASINSNSQQTYKHFDVEEKKFVRVTPLDIEDKEERQAYVDAKIESGEWIYTTKASEEHRSHIKERFYENDKDIYIVLYNAMVSIDAPKTLYFPSSNDMKVINEKYFNKPNFLKYRERKENVVANQYAYSFGLLDHVAGIIDRELLDEIENVQREFRDRSELIREHLVNGEYTISKYPSCLESINELYKSYTTEREDAYKDSSRKRKKLGREKQEIMEQSGWDQYREEEYQSSISEVKAEQLEKYKEIDAKYIVKADNIMKDYDLPTIANAVGNMDKCTEAFIINLFYPAFKYLNEKLQNDRYAYKKDKSGDILFLNEIYKKVSIGMIDNRQIVKKQHVDEKKRLKAIDVKADIRARVLDDKAIQIIKSELETNDFLVFNINVSDNKVILKKDEQELLEVFKDRIQIGEYNLLNCSKLKVELLVNEAPKKTSLQLTVTEITV